MDELEMEHRMTSVEKLASSNKKRIDDLETDNKVLQELSSSVKVMAEQLKTMNEKFNKMDATVQRLTDRPGTMWEGVIKSIATAFIAGIIGYMLYRLGLKA